jgi:hypothetical protein
LNEKLRHYKILEKKIFYLGCCFLNLFIAVMSLAIEANQSISQPSFSYDAIRFYFLFPLDTFSLFKKEKEKEKKKFRGPFRHDGILFVMHQHIRPPCA